jgi:tRNA A-37 threonylcarbamoyl transferase component Bud32
MISPPSAEDLAAYRRGTLSLERFQAIDAWLESLDPSEQVRLLEGEAFMPLPTADAGNGPAFRSDASRARFVLGELIGRGGMGEVRLARDIVLDRDVALKLCRPRQFDEALADYALRLRAFRREATVTAQLEHPAIVPIHDAGLGPHGEPAYVMKRLEGRSLDQVMSERRLDLVDTVETVLRIAEALAHAHQRGIVHRDLKPANVLIGQLGGVWILDWGLAARIGGAGERAGTPPWTAPEQEHGAPTDPRMDVYALGTLLLALLTGQSPQPQFSLSLQNQPIPRGLAALIRACLDNDPARRPGNATAVAMELRRWLSAGVTAAERPNFLRRALMFSRRSPRAVAGIILVLVLAVSISATVMLDRQAKRDQLRARLHELAATPLDDVPALRAGIREIGSHPAAEARTLTVRFQAAIDAAEARNRLELQRSLLRGLTIRYRQQGPWTDEENDLRASLAEAGIRFGDPLAAAHAVRSSPLRDDLLAILVQLQRSLLMSGRGDGERHAIPEIICGAIDAPAWHGLAELLTKTRVEAHDLVLCECPDSERALRDPVTADLLLATYGPEPRLVHYATERLLQDPGSFWPRIISARAAYDAHRDDNARQHALVALGRDARSLWPHLLLAYLALRAGDDITVVAEAEAGLQANADHLELRLLRAVGLARQGKRAAAEALVAEPAVAAHLQYHHQHAHGHPMEDAVAALTAVGISIPDVPAELGPLVPHGHHHQTPVPDVPIQR